MKSHQKRDITYIKGMWYNKTFITNIIILKDVTEKFCLEMDLKEELALLVHMPNKIIMFKQFLDGLYSMRPNDENSFVPTS